MDKQTVQKSALIVLPPGSGEFYGPFPEALTRLTTTLLAKSGEVRRLFLNNEINLAVVPHTPDTPCFEYIDFFKSASPSTPVIVVTDCGSEELAVSVFRSGVKDYFRKPFEADELISRIYNLSGFETSPERRRRSDFHSDGFRRAVQYIRDNYKAELPLTKVANEGGMSVSCFERVFKREMGTTFIPYLNSLRIAESVRILKRNRLSISEIAFECGFTNQYHFSRTFRKIMETSPGTYRRE